MCNLLFKELATGEGFHPRPLLVSDALHFWATFVHSFNGMVLSVLPKFLCCLPPLNTTMGQISWNFLCVPGYLHLPFSSSKNYLRKSFYVMRMSKLFVLLTFEDSSVVWLAPQCFETEEGSRKSHKSCTSRWREACTSSMYDLGNTH